VTIARRNNLSVYSGVNRVINSIVTVCSGQYTLLGRGVACISVLLVLLKGSTACVARVGSHSTKRSVLFTH
jgi:hypothetical protein